MAAGALKWDMRSHPNRLAIRKFVDGVGLLHLLLGGRVKRHVAELLLHLPHHLYIYSVRHKSKRRSQLSPPSLPEFDGLFHLSNQNTTKHTHTQAQKKEKSESPSHAERTCRAWTCRAKPEGRHPAYGITAAYLHLCGGVKVMPRPPKEQL